VTAATLTAPPLLQTLDLIADPIRFFDKHQQRHGDSFSARVLGLNSPPVHFFGDPEAVQTLFTAPPDTFALGRVTDVFRPLTGPHSLIQLDGAEHQRQRKLLMPPLHGDLSQSARERVTSRLRSGQLGVVIATDVASRGIDVGQIGSNVRGKPANSLESATAIEGGRQTWTGWL